MTYYDSILILQAFGAWQYVSDLPETTVNIVKPPAAEIKKKKVEKKKVETKA
jgi:hypothetical protein